MSGLGQIGAVVSSVSGAVQTPSQGGAPFGDIFKGLASQTSKLDDSAQKAVTGLLTGQASRFMRR